MSGGSAADLADTDPASASSTHVAIVSGTIDTASLLKAIKQPEDGAAVVFEGVVRNHTRGRRTLYLDYEAYEEMALKQMEELAERALADFKIRDVADRSSPGAAGDRRDQRADRGGFGPPGGLPSTPAAGSSIPSSVPCPSGRRSISKMARSGPTAKPFPRTFPAPRAPIPRSVHLSEQAVFALGTVTERGETQPSLMKRAATAGLVLVLCLVSAAQEFSGF